MKNIFFLFVIFLTTTVDGQQLDFVRLYKLYDNNYAYGVAVTHNNQRLITGQTQLHTDDIYYLMKLDSAGNLIWTTYGDLYHDGGYTEGRVVLELSNGNYVVGCHTCCGANEIFLAIYDSAG